MLIKENLRETAGLSTTERYVAEYLINVGIEVKDMSTGDIAKITYTSPATSVRLAKKLGFSGWNELKEKLAEEIAYMDSHFVDVDANYPFKKGDTLMTIANKIGALEIETIKDTISLLNFEELHYTIHHLNTTGTIYIFGTSVSLILAEKFKYKMVRLGKMVNVSMIHSEQLYDICHIKPGDSAIILSYSGEDDFLIEIADHLLSRGIDIVSITNIGANTIAKKSKYHLYCSTREKLNDKIAAYSSVNSMDYLLDLIYSGIFSLNYEENVNLRLKYATMIERHRTSDSEQLADKISLSYKEKINNK